MPPEDMSGYANVIPEAVRRQSERADQLAREAGVTGVKPLEGDKPAEGTKPGEADKPGDKTTTVVKNEGETQPRQEGARQGEPRQSETRQSETRDLRQGGEPRQSENEIDWQQRYQTLEGKYRAEVPALNNQLRQLQGQIEGLQTMLANLSTPREPAKPTVEAPAKHTIAAEDVEAYGEDLVTAARRWARAEIAPELDQLKAKLNHIETQSTRTETTLSQSAVERGLDAMLPNWRVTNDDPQFLQWLANIDPFSGRIRHDMLKEAYSRGDAPRTASFFRAFTTEHTAIQPGTRTQQTHTTDASAAGRPTLESLAAPGRANAASGGGGGAQTEQRVWSRDQITAFYRDVQRGLFEGREAEKARIEQDFVTASAEGRVR